MRQTNDNTRPEVPIANRPGSPRTAARPDARIPAELDRVSPDMSGRGSSARSGVIAQHPGPGVGDVPAATYAAADHPSSSTFVSRLEYEVIAIIRAPTGRRLIRVAFPSPTS
jgi:hypothetical protein